MGKGELAMMVGSTHYEEIHKTMFSERCQASKLLDIADERGEPIAVEVGNMHQVSSLFLEVAKSRLRDANWSFWDLITNEDFRSTLLSMLPFPVSDSVFRSTVVLSYHVATYEHAGKRTYLIHPDLAEKLKHTELRGMRSEDLRLPYEALYIEVPPSLGFKVWNEDTGWHDLRGIYLAEDHHVNWNRSTLGEVNLMRGWRILLVGKGKPEFGDMDDAISFFDIPLKEGEKLETILDHLTREMHQLVRQFGCGKEWNPEMDWSGMFRWAMNVVLYATWEEPGEHWEASKEARQLWERVRKLKPGKKRSNLQQKLNNCTKRPRIVLGKKVRVSRGESGAFDGESGTGSPTTVRTRVSGHWRKQPHGPQSSLRRMQWIEPFWRGPVDGPVSVPDHELVG